LYAQGLNNKPYNHSVFRGHKAALVQYFVRSSKYTDFQQSHGDVCNSLSVAIMTGLTKIAQVVISFTLIMHSTKAERQKKQMP